MGFWGAYLMDEDTPYGEYVTKMIRRYRWEECDCRFFSLVHSAQTKSHPANKEKQCPRVQPTHTSRGVPRWTRREPLYGLKGRGFKASAVQSAHGLSILRGHPPAIRSKK